MKPVKPLDLYDFKNLVKEHTAEHDFGGEVFVEWNDTHLHVRRVYLDREGDLIIEAG